MQGMARITEVCTQVRELYMSAVHDVTEQLKSSLPLSSLTFYRQTGPCRAWLVSSRTFGPSPPCLFLCPGHLEKSDDASLCPAAGSTPACTPNDHAAPQHAGSPCTPHHLCAEGLRLLELAGLAPPAERWGPGPHGSTSCPVLLRASFVSHCDCTYTHT